MRLPARVRTRLRSFSIVLALSSLSAQAADYGAIAEQNLFDPQRKPWSEPAPLAAVPTLTPEDIQIQGVVVLGGVRRAIVKLGGRLRQFAPGGAAGRFNAVLGEGQVVGGYTLESVEAKQLVFASGGNRFTVPFTRSAQRVTASAPSAPLPVIQSATLPVAEPLLIQAAQPAPRLVPVPPGFPPLTPPAAAPVATSPATTSTTPLNPARPPPPLSPAEQAARQQAAAAPATGGMSLLEAIQAAEAARRAGQLPAAPPFNPFQPRSP